METPQGCLYFERNNRTIKKANKGLQRFVLPQMHGLPPGFVPSLPSPLRPSISAAEIPENTTENTTVLSFVIHKSSLLRASALVHDAATRASPAPPPRIRAQALCCEGVLPRIDRLVGELHAVKLGAVGRVCSPTRRPARTLSCKDCSSSGTAAAQVNNTQWAPARGKQCQARKC